MPVKPKRACSHPMCPNLTNGRFCEEHQRQENKRYEKYDRDPIVRKRYNGQWRKIRSRYVKEYSYCELCFKEGRIKAVEEVHHKLPLSKGGTHDIDNLISLCQSCHARIHATDGSRWNKK